VKLPRALQPLVALIALAIVLIALATVARAVSASAGFLVERQVVLMVWLAGLVLAGAIFGWIARCSWRRDDSPSSLWLKTVTVLALASPLALMLLQHPAH
jgi:4-amino-4-deoxy-L-arabinose transferase-like glycosyltransferase